MHGAAPAGSSGGSLWQRRSAAQPTPVAVPGSHALETGHILPSPECSPPERSWGSSTSSPSPHVAPPGAPAGRAFSAHASPEPADSIGIVRSSVCVSPGMAVVKSSDSIRNDSISGSSVVITVEARGALAPSSIDGAQVGEQGMSTTAGGPASWWQKGTAAIARLLLLTWHARDRQRRVAHGGADPSPLTSRAGPAAGSAAEDAREGDSASAEGVVQPVGLRICGTTNRASHQSNQVLLAAMRERRLPEQVWEKVWTKHGYPNVRSVRSWLELYEWTTRDGQACYPAIFTVTLSFILVGIFLFMAGQYSAFLVTSAPDATKRAQQVQALKPGPLSLYDWLAFWKTMLFANPDTSFNFDYLLLWGAKYAPLMAHEGWRWLSPLLLHQHANHLLTNVLLFIEFSWPLERLHGPVRLLLLFVLSGLGATFSSALWEPPCQAMVGASGAIFGVIGAQLADVALNFDSLCMPWLKLGVTLLVLLVVAVLQATLSPPGAISTAAHVGGGITGLATALLLFPNVMDKRWCLLDSMASKLGFTTELRALLDKAIAASKQQQEQGLEETAEAISCGAESALPSSEPAALAEHVGCQEGGLEAGGLELTKNPVFQAPCVHVAAASGSGSGLVGEPGHDVVLCVEDGSCDARPAADQQGEDCCSSTAGSAHISSAKAASQKHGDLSPKASEGSDLAPRARCVSDLADQLGAGSGSAADLDPDTQPQACIPTVIICSWWSRYRPLSLNLQVMSACWLLLALLVQPVYLSMVVLPAVQCDA